MRGSSLFSILVTALVLGATAVALNISVAAIIYQGDLAAYIDRGIALTMLGAAPMAAVGAFTLSYRGTVSQPQDAPAIILSLAAGNIAAGMADPGSERSFATIVALVVLTTAASGIVAWLMGRLRLGFVARFIPFPVLAGFLAATGYLLIMGALGMTLGTHVGISNLPMLFAPGNPERWLPWIILGLVIALVLRRFGNPLILPLSIVAVAIGFYGVLAGLGMGLADARLEGLLLGPFSAGGFLPSLRGWQPFDVDWLAIAAQAPSILTIVGLTSATALLSASALDVAINTRIDPDRDLRGIGLSNLAGAAGGGPAGYHVLAETLLARQMGSNGRANGLIVAASFVATLIFGGSAISALPVGLFAFLIMVIGVSMLLEALLDQRRSLPAADYAVVLIIPAVTAVFGFLPGVAVGLLAAALLFIMTFARIDVVRLETTGARIRSRVERPDAQQASLAELGQQTAVYVLAGYIFFGTAHRLVHRIQTALQGEPRPRFVLIDFSRVRGLDTSAARALARLDDRCRAEGATLYLTSLAPGIEGLVRGQVADAGPRIVGQLEEALEEVEATLLTEVAAADAAPEFLDQVRLRHPATDLDAYFRIVSVPAGDEVITQGAPSDFLLVLRSGALRTEVIVEGRPPMMVARCLPGALVGEIGLYAGVPRTARVVAELPSEFLRIDAAALARMSRDDPAMLADFHRAIASIIARRLGRTTALLADSEAQAG